jgi:hypothetical protein
MKALMAADILCAYPDQNKLFHIFTGASEYQPDACIMQEDKPVAFYSKKLNSAQMNYMTIDQDLLCAGTTLCTFRSMLLGAELHVHIDHKNILSIGDSLQKHLCWISYVDEYRPELHYVEGPHNIGCASLLESAGFLQNSWYGLLKFPEHSYLSSRSLTKHHTERTGTFKNRFFFCLNVKIRPSQDL